MAGTSCAVGSSDGSACSNAVDGDLNSVATSSSGVGGLKTMQVPLLSVSLFPIFVSLFSYLCHY
jgi:hypothetical protein